MNFERKLVICKLHIENFIFQQRLFANNEQFIFGTLKKYRLGDFII